MKKYSCILFTLFFSLTVMAQEDTVQFEGETHFKNVQQLTFGGDNAEAYWSFDSKRIVFQKTNPKEGIVCDQIFMGNLPLNAVDPFKYKLVSTGKGRTTCAYFMKDGKHIIYASTHEGSADCPAPVDRAKYGNKYIWPLYNTYDIFMADTNGNGLISTTERNACLALRTVSMPGGGTRTGPSTAGTRSPCHRKAWASVLGSIDDAQLKAWSQAQERNGLTAQTSPPRSIYWIDSPADWHTSVGTPEVPALLVFSALACAQRCPRIGAGVRIMGSVLLDSGCNDEKMRGWEGGRIEGQLVVESGMPEWRSGTVVATPQGRDAYILNWPEGIDARRIQRINGSWSEGSP